MSSYSTGVIASDSRSSASFLSWSSASVGGRRGCSRFHLLNQGPEPNSLPANRSQMIRPVIITTRPARPTIVLPASNQRRRAMIETPAKTMPTCKPIADSSNMR